MRNERQGVQTPSKEKCGRERKHFKEIPWLKQQCAGTIWKGLKADRDHSFTLGKTGQKLSQLSGQKKVFYKEKEDSFPIIVVGMVWISWMPIILKNCVQPWTVHQRSLVRFPSPRSKINNIYDLWSFSAERQCKNFKVKKPTSHFRAQMSIRK